MCDVVNTSHDQSEGYWQHQKQSVKWTTSGSWTWCKRTRRAGEKAPGGVGKEAVKVAPRWPLKTVDKRIRSGRKKGDNGTKVQSGEHLTRSKPKEHEGSERSNGQNNQALDAQSLSAQNERCDASLMRVSQDECGRMRRCAQITKDQHDATMRAEHEGEARKGNATLRTEHKIEEYRWCSEHETRRRCTTDVQNEERDATAVRRARSRAKTSVQVQCPGVGHNENHEARE
ncbi:hypothetical protein K438DRAFT_1748625 [Mycena galopus ATCC 62051]|nr:hypothetical protein K438DRAFT_1748625 [Mycena galopus ATCC 62051]